MKKFFILLLLSHFSIAQNEISKKISFENYIETYYSYDFSQPKNHSKAPFLYNFHRSNEVNLNLGLFKVAFQDTNSRANFGIMVGTYPNTNLAAETGVLKNIYEANIGVKISKKQNIWLDMGVFSSHIGFESAIGKDCWNLSRSLLAENSPYYESGIRISYKNPNEKWFLNGFLLNGWQQITRTDGNKKISFGSQILFVPSNIFRFNWSTFLGTRPDDVSKKRIFNNFYSILAVSKKLEFIAGFDYGIEGNNKLFSRWFSPILIGKYQINSRWVLSSRVENYSDKSGVIISKDFVVNGFSVNLDFIPYKNILLRVESRHLKSKNAIFKDKFENESNKNTFLTTSFSIGF